MTVDDKILMSVQSAMSYLENSISALDRKDESAFADRIWHVSAELEYSLFLFSIMFQDESNHSEWKPHPRLKVETGSFLGEAKALLSEAVKFMENGNFLDAYENAYTARDYIFKVQEDLARKKRALKKK